MDNVRILKGYSKQERKELEEAKDNGFLSAIDLINGIGEDDDCTSLTEKYINGSPDEDNQLAKDIADFYCGKAKFAEQKYYVHLIKGNEKSYLNITSYGSVDLLSNLEYSGQKNKFTRDEVIDIDPRLVPFMEEVEDNE